MRKGDGWKIRLSIPKIEPLSHPEYLESAQKAGGVLFVKYLPLKYYLNRTFLGLYLSAMK